MLNARTSRRVAQKRPCLSSRRVAQKRPGLLSVALAAALLIGTACSSGSSGTFVPGWVDVPMPDPGSDGSAVADGSSPVDGDAFTRPTPDGEGGDEPDVEVDVLHFEDVVPGTGEVGEKCKDGSDCRSSLCVSAYLGRVCSDFCVDQDCPVGWMCRLLQNPGQDPLLLCLPGLPNLCRPCSNDEECTELGTGNPGDRCVPFGPERGSFCGNRCESTDDCPSGFHCEEVLLLDSESRAMQCLPNLGRCECGPLATEVGATTRCVKVNDGHACDGLRRCTSEGLTECDAPEPELEVCNGKDDDCDGETDEELHESPCTRRNQHGGCAGTTVCIDGHGDCNAPEPGEDVCDGEDNDCDGETDKGFDDTDNDALADCVDEDDDDDGRADAHDNCQKTPNPDQQDLDQDGAGDACDPDDDNDEVPDEEDNCRIVFNPDQVDSDLDGRGNECDVDDDDDGDPDSLDCDITNPLVFHGAAEVCNGVDDNCEGGADEEGAAGCEDWLYDGDGDGYGGETVPEGVEPSRCLCEALAPHTALLPGDCNDHSADKSPGAAEKCNGVDDNCDGIIDPEGSEGAKTYYRDKDKDGYGRPSEFAVLCEPTGQFNVERGDDCNDDSPAVSPAAPEFCNGSDDNCDDNVDPEGSIGCTTFYNDGDDDGYGVVSDYRCLCLPDAPHDTTVVGDCCDTDPSVNPAQGGYFKTPNACGGWDYNCNNRVEQHWGSTGSCSALLTFCFIEAKGWAQPPPPCGVDGNWIKECDQKFGSCKEDTENKTQECH
jgi:hypothetical protein